MPVVNPSLCVGAQTPVRLSPRRNNFQDNRNFHRRATSRGSMQFQPLNQRNFPRLQAIGTGSKHANSSGFISTSKRSVFVCNAALNARCSQGQTQTQTVTRPVETITQAPSPGKERPPELDDDGTGSPPGDDGGGGGGGGGGGNSSGGFFLFGFLLFMGYLKDLEGEHDNNR